MTEEPLYNIGVVTRVTGIPIATLHAWERRYSFPSTSRTAGGHRLYSEKDIASLRWVKSQMDNGLTISRAIAAARSLEAEGRLLTSTLPLGMTPQAPEAPVSPKNDHETFLEALLHNDLTRADQVMGEMLAFHSPEYLTLEVIGPAMAYMGDAWENGQISAATEHLISNYLRHRLLMWMVTGPNPRPINPVVLSCCPGEWHEGSLLMMGVLLRRRGWPVAYLGQNVPFPDLGKFVEEIKPPMVVLVAMRSETGVSLGEWQNWITQRNGRPVVGYGGRAFSLHPELHLSTPGVYLGNTLTEGIQKIEECLQA